MQPPRQPIPISQMKFFAEYSTKSSARAELIFTRQYRRNFLTIMDLQARKPLNLCWKEKPEE
jgi:hypothetical protein